MNKHTLSIVIPVYFNQDSLIPLHDALVRVEQELKERSVGLELIFVDDGSGDKSLDRLLEIWNSRQQVKILSLTRNFGSIQACKAGLSQVTGDCCAILAADIQDPPEILVGMVDEWLSGYKLVIGARKTRNDPLLTKFFSWVFYKALKLLVVKDYPRKGFDVALMDRQVVKYLNKSGKNINIQLYILSLGFDSKTLLYDRRKREHGRSKWTFKKKLILVIDSFLGFSTKPIRLVSLLGVSIVGVSLLVGVFFAVVSYFDIYSFPGYATLVFILSFFFGVIIITQGIIGEYLLRIHDQVNNFPEYVIDRAWGIGGISSNGDKGDN